MFMPMFPFPTKRKAPGKKKKASKSSWFAMCSAVELKQLCKVQYPFIIRDLQTTMMVTRTQNYHYWLVFCQICIGKAAGVAVSGAKSVLEHRLIECDISKPYAYTKSPYRFSRSSVFMYGHAPAKKKQPKGAAR